MVELAAPDVRPANTHFSSGPCSKRPNWSLDALKDAALDGNVVRGKLEAGQSVGLVEDIVPAGELVKRIADEYAVAIAGLPQPSR